MAWTAPRTWTDGELVTAAIMNPHVRDNLLAVGPHLIGRKTSDQSVTSSTAMVDATSLGGAVAANEVWQFEWAVKYIAGTTGDIKFGLTFPTSGDVCFDAVWPGTNGTLQMNTWSTGTSPTSAINLLGDGSTLHFVRISGIYIGAGNAGTVQLQFAQVVSDGTASTVKAQSTLWGVKLA